MFACVFFFIIRHPWVFVFLIWIFNFCKKNKVFEKPQILVIFIKIKFLHPPQPYPGYLNTIIVVSVWNFVVFYKLVNVKSVFLRLSLYDRLFFSKIYTKLDFSFFNSKVLNNFIKIFPANDPNSWRLGRIDETDHETAVWKDFFYIQYSYIYTTRHKGELVTI